MASVSWLNSGDTPSHLSVWSKYFLGWMNPNKVNRSSLNEPINYSEAYDDAYMLLDNPGDTRKFKLDIEWERYRRVFPCREQAKNRL